MQGSKNFLGVGDQDLQQFWDQVSKFKVEMGDQAGKIYLVTTLTLWSLLSLCIVKK